MIKIGGSKSTGTALLAYPGYAYPNESHYLVHVSGMAWRTPVVFNRRQKVMIRMLGGVMHASPDDLSSDIFQERITPFMAAARKRKSVIITINGVNYRLTKKTRGTGQFFGWVNVPRQHLDLAFQNGETCIPYRVSFDDELVEPAEGIVHIYERVGTSVVSDIDDTIKDSLVADRRALLTNTFLREFRSIEGMPRVYNEWSDRGASFHYVSSSPWQLFESLDEMTDRCGFPRGTMHLRNFRLRDQFLKKFLIRRKGKATAIRTLMKKMPGEISCWSVIQVKGMPRSIAKSAANIPAGSRESSYETWPRVR